MRRVVFVFTVISLAGWSQSAPLQPQPPLQSTNSKQPPENPPNPWTQIANLAPGIITAFSALAAVWLTQRHQLRLEIAKAEIAAKYKTQDRRWDFQKDVYSSLVRIIVELMTVYTKQLGVAKGYSIGDRDLLHLVTELDTELTKKGL